MAAVSPGHRATGAGAAGVPEPTSRLGADAATGGVASDPKWCGIFQPRARRMWWVAEMHPIHARVRSNMGMHARTLGIMVGWLAHGARGL